MATTTSANATAMLSVQFYKVKMCPWLSKKTGCLKGALCNFAHSEEELRQAPDLSKTSMCKRFLNGNACPLPSHKCPYAHGEHELRSTEAYLKTTICRLWLNGNACPYSAHECRNAHGENELRKRPVCRVFPVNTVHNARACRN
eukprot:GDKI01040127.1.p1 GENE.GDKI01040127.1~~GDKI01040127.1.p1  ORF type:complete len:144 (+),score=27.62 GDKI01040127.1:111-542(+)